MHYLGGLRGTGVLTSGNTTIARADFDFDGYLVKPDRVTGCGEIRMTAKALREAFGRKDLQLLTDDGRLLDIQFSEKRLGAESDSAHVNVTGDLPLAAEWRH